jgi:hypothetical protein
MTMLKGLGLNPFVIAVGPDFVRRPWTQQYCDPRIVHEVFAAMQGREALYGQMHDLLNLLGLQTHPLTLDTQRAVSQLLAHDVWAAMTRLAA